MARNFKKSFLDKKSVKMILHPGVVIVFYCSNAMQFLIYKDSQKLRGFCAIAQSILVEINSAKSSKKAAAIARPHE